MKIVLRDQLRIISGIQDLRVADDAKILHAAEDRQGLGRIDIWFEQEEEPGKITKQPLNAFRVIATGEPFQDGWDHLSTVVMKSGLIWHIYRSNIKAAR